MHGMESAAVVEKSGDSFTVRGLLFHMEGPWIVRIRVRQGSAPIPLI